MKRASPTLRQLDVPRTVVGRLLNALEEANFVERLAGTSRYRIGVVALELGVLYLVDNPLVVNALDVLDDAAQQTGYTAYLGTLDRGDAVILALREGPSTVRFVWSVGDRLPAATTALGTAMLMHMDGAQFDTVLGGGTLVGLTDDSITSRADLDRQLAGARAKGWITADNESYPGVSAVGAAVFDGAGQPVAGVSISFLAYPPRPEVVEDFGRLVVVAAAAVSRRVAVGQHPVLGGAVTAARERPARRRSMD